MQRSRLYSDFVRHLTFTNFRNLGALETEMQLYNYIYILDTLLVNNGTVAGHAWQLNMFLEVML